MHSRTAFAFLLCFSLSFAAPIAEEVDGHVLEKRQKALSSSQPSIEIVSSCKRTGVIALVIEAGFPSKKTESLANALMAANAKGTFFVPGPLTTNTRPRKTEYSAAQKNTLQFVLSSGMEVGLAGSTAAPVDIRSHLPGNPSQTNLFYLQPGSTSQPSLDAIGKAGYTHSVKPTISLGSVSSSSSSINRALQTVANHFKNSNNPSPIISLKEASAGAVKLIKDLVAAQTGKKFVSLSECVKPEPVQPVIPVQPVVPVNPIVPVKPMEPVKPNGCILENGSYCPDEFKVPGPTCKCLAVNVPRIRVKDDIFCSSALEIMRPTDVKTTSHFAFCHSSSHCAFGVCQGSASPIVKGNGAKCQASQHLYVASIYQINDVCGRARPLLDQSQIWVDQVQVANTCKGKKQIALVLTGDHEWATVGPLAFQSIPVTHFFSAAQNDLTGAWSRFSETGIIWTGDLTKLHYSDYRLKMAYQQGNYILSNPDVIEKAKEAANDLGYSAVISEGIKVDSITGQGYEKARLAVLYGGTASFIVSFSPSAVNAKEPTYLQRFVAEALNNGYKFVTMAECLASIPQLKRVPQAKIAHHSRCYNPKQIALVFNTWSTSMRSTTTAQSRLEETSRALSESGIKGTIVVHQPFGNIPSSQGVQYVTGADYDIEPLSVPKIYEFLKRNGVVPKIQFQLVGSSDPERKKISENLGYTHIVTPTVIKQNEFSESATVKIAMEGHTHSPIILLDRWGAGITKETLSQIKSIASANGYQLVTLDECLGIKSA